MKKPLIDTIPAIAPTFIVEHVSCNRCRETAVVIVRNGDDANHWLRACEFHGMQFLQEVMAKARVSARFVSDDSGWANSVIAGALAIGKGVR